MKKFTAGVILGLVVAFSFPVVAQVAFPMAVKANRRVEALERYLGLNCESYECKKIQK